MSRTHLEDLFDALKNVQWRLITPDPFTLEDEQVTWTLVRGDEGRRIELEFHAFGDLGQRTNALRDIYCVEPSTVAGFTSTRGTARNGRIP